MNEAKGLYAQVSVGEKTIIISSFRIVKIIGDRVI